MSSLSLFGIAALAAASILPMTAQASQVKVDAELGQEAIVRGKGKIYLRINLAGLPAPSEKQRTPVNVAVVIDRSGSMADEDKIGKAREAAIMALGRLGANDIASVVAYNHEVDVLFPATRITDHGRVTKAIEALQADGNTALYAGTEQGIREVSKFLGRERVNRVILISDGLANVGPSTPEELADLGRKAGGKGITVSTIGLGLGYNEDLMTKLAYASDGNHAFVESSDQLVDIFNKEFGDALNIVAQDIIINIQLKLGFKPIRALSREAEIDGNVVKLKLNQIAGNQNKYVVLEIEAPDNAPLGEVDIADVTVSYQDLNGQDRVEMKSNVRGRLTDKVEEAEATINKPVMTDVTTQLATEANEEAVKLRDEGRMDDARKKLEQNATILRDAAKTLSAPALGTMAEQSLKDADEMQSGDWNRTRKSMKANQYKSKAQQAY